MDRDVDDKPPVVGIHELRQVVVDGFRRIIGFDEPEGFQGLHALSESLDCGNEPLVAVAGFGDPEVVADDKSTHWRRMTVTQYVTCEQPMPGL